MNLGKTVRRLRSSNFVNNKVCIMYTFCKLKFLFANGEDPQA